MTTGPTPWMVSTSSTDQGAETTRRRGWLALAAVLAAGALALLGWTFWQRPQADAAQAERATTHVRALAQTGGADLSAAWQVARAYNERLAQAPVRVFGEAIDPATSAPFADGDDAYLGALDPLGDSVMARLTIPSIDVDLPVLRGTSATTLARGVGHLYGTSVPVGGPATHAVLTAHSGQVTSTGFRHLDALEVGDAVVVEVLGQRLEYRVDRVEVIDPDDFSRFAITPTEDRLTLMTCTPVGWNTHRLLVSAVRVLARLDEDAPTGDETTTAQAASARPTDPSGTGGRP